MGLDNEFTLLHGFKPESGHKIFMVNGLSVKAAGI
jgi:hypothetical protein